MNAFGRLALHGYHFGTLKRAMEEARTTIAADSAAETDPHIRKDLQSVLGMLRSFDRALRDEAVETTTTQLWRVRNGQ